MIPATRPRALVVILTALVLVSACAPRQALILQPVPTPPPRYELKGYSLVPPNETGWLVAQRTAEQLQLARRGANTDETFAIHAALTDLPTPLTSDGLVKLMAERETNDLQSGRFRVAKHEVIGQTYAGATCAKSYFLAQDTAPVRQSARTDAIELEGAFLSCLHPQDPRIGVMLGYSQRRYPEHRDAAFAASAETVFATLRFADL